MAQALLLFLDLTVFNRNYDNAKSAYNSTKDQLDKTLATLNGRNYKLTEEREEERRLDDKMNALDYKDKTLHTERTESTRRSTYLTGLKVRSPAIVACSVYVTVFMF